MPLMVCRWKPTRPWLSKPDALYIISSVLLSDPSKFSLLAAPAILRAVDIWLTFVLRFFSISWRRFISFPDLVLKTVVKDFFHIQENSSNKLWLAYHTDKGSPPSTLALNYKWLVHLILVKYTLKDQQIKGFPLLTCRIPSICYYIRSSYEKGFLNKRGWALNKQKFP